MYINFIGCQLLTLSTQMLPLRRQNTHYLLLRIAFAMSLWKMLINVYMTFNLKFCHNYFRGNFHQHL